MSAYYNEHDREKAAWLRELMKAGVIAPGEVDERSIEDVRPSDLDGFDQCHFFAGIGVWSYALRLAGWPDDQPVWTGSCPCQPFSAAGKGDGFADERHLWPAWFHLIEERRPDELFGEQVASPDGLLWFDLVRADMEGAGYACGPADICAAGVGAPHIRQRNFWVAQSGRERREGKRLRLRARRPLATVLEAWGRGEARSMANTDSRQRDGIAVVRGLELDREDARRSQSGGEPGSRGEADELGDTGSSRLEIGSLDVVEPRAVRVEGAAIIATGAVRGFWDGADWLYCRDGKYRPVEPGTFPLAHGAPFRVGRLRGYGDAIVAQAAAEVIRAAMSESCF